MNQKTPKQSFIQSKSKFISSLYYRKFSSNPRLKNRMKWKESTLKRRAKFSFFGFSCLVFVILLFMLLVGVCGLYDCLTPSSLLKTIFPQKDSIPNSDSKRISLGFDDANELDYWMLEDLPTSLQNVGSLDCYANHLKRNINSPRLHPLQELKISTQC